MTINVAAATYDAVVLGCDSLSTFVEQALFPFRGDAIQAVDANGLPMVDGQGNPVFAARSDLPLIATGVMGGVRKMFVLLEDDNCDCSIAAVTSGMGSLNGITVAELAHRYRRQVRVDNVCFTTIDEAVQHFLEHMRGLWEEHRDASGFEGGLNFLVAGYCTNDAYTKVFRVSVHDKGVHEQFPTTTHPYNCGVAWDGQSAFASRLMMGISGDLQQRISRGIIDAMTAQRNGIVSSIFEKLQEAGVVVPDGLELNFDVSLPAGLPWTAAQAPIQFGSLPVQTTVELVSTLVNTESSMQKFVMGVPTVGGRTRIGLLRRNVPFAMLNEPDLIHAHTGYVTDA